MKIIVLHDRYSNEPIIFRVDAINVIHKRVDEVEGSRDEYSNVTVGNMIFDVKEHTDVVMKKINAVENKHISGEEKHDTN